MLGNVVRYNFFAIENIDKETYSLDHAVVIDVNEEDGQVKILPITNTFCKDSIESFCLGKIEGFVEIRNEGFKELDQYVRFDKVMLVNKDEISSLKAQDEYGNINQDYIDLYVNSDQLTKILDKYKEYTDGEIRNVVNLLLKSEPKYKLNMQASSLATDMDVYLKKMDKYREYNYNNQKIIVFYVEGQRYSLVMDATDNTDIKSRNEELKLALVS